jgi:hypothetical protein
MRPDASQAHALVEDWKHASEANKGAMTSLEVMENLQRFNSLRRLKKATVRFVVGSLLPL